MFSMNDMIIPQGEEEDKTVGRDTLKQKLRSKTVLFNIVESEKKKWNLKRQETTLTNLRKNSLSDLSSDHQNQAQNSLK